MRRKTAFKAAKNKKLGPKSGGRKRKRDLGDDDGDDVDDELDDSDQLRIYLSKGTKLRPLIV